jgi:TolB protein
VDTVPPVFSNPSPAPQLPLVRTSQTSAVVLIADDSGVDLDSLAFTVNGSAYGYNSGGVSFDVATGSLTIALGALNPAPIIHDGDIVTVSITQLADLAGNKITQPFTWSWQADYSAAVGGGFGPVTFNGGKDAAWSPDSQRLAFASNRFGNDDLFVLASQTNSVIVESSASLTRVTSSSANENQPAWSPDGRRLAYVSDVTGNRQIWMTAADGSGSAVQLSSSAADDTHPSWSADGSEIYFARSTSGLGNVWAIDMDTATWQKTGEHQTSKDDIGFDLEPAISPDGATVVYHRSLYVDNLYSVGINGLAPQALTATGADITPSWSPDGRQIVFASKRNSPAYQLWLMDHMGGNPKLLLDNLNTWPETQPAWSPDSGRIAFTTTRSGSPNIWIISVLQVGAFTASPTPFSPAGASPSAKKTITFSYSLSGSNAVVSLDIVRPSATIAASVIHLQSQNGGAHSITWNGRDANNTPVPDGAYQARLTITGAAALDPIVRQFPIVVDSTPPGIALQSSDGDLSRGYFNPK